MGAKTTIDVGRKFNRLVVVKELPKRKFPSGQTQRLFLCKCVCGIKTSVQLSNLISGNTVSCGCFNVEELSKRKTHGKSKDKLYGVYKAMLARCYDENNISYHNYGARGIKVCKGWRNSKTGLDDFYDWATVNGYGEGLELDRIDTDRHYKPSNCRFITHVQNNRNKRGNVIVDDVLTIEYFEKHDKGIVHKRTFDRRLLKGWSLEDAINTPSQRGKPL